MGDTDGQQTSDMRRFIVHSLRQHQRPNIRWIAIHSSPAPADGTLPHGVVERQPVAGGFRHRYRLPRRDLWAAGALGFWLRPELRQETLGELQLGHGVVDGDVSAANRERSCLISLLRMANVTSNFKK